MNTDSEEIVDVESIEGQWTLLSDAVKITGLNEKTLRRHAATSKVRSRKLGKQHNAKMEILLTTEYLEMVKRVAVSGFEEILIEDTAEDDPISTQAESPKQVDSKRSEDLQNLRSLVSSQLSEIVKQFTHEFASKLEEKTDIIQQLKKELDEKEIQLRLLPDMKKANEEKQRLENELEEVRKEKNLLAESLAEAALAKAEAEKIALELEQTKLKIKELERPWWKKAFGN